jgi:hypothetical protein
MTEGRTKFIAVKVARECPLVLMVMTNVAGGKVEGWEVAKLSMESLYSMLQGSRASHVKVCSSIT